MSDQEPKNSILAGLDIFRNARQEAGVDNAKSSLDGAISQYDQAAEGLDQMDESVSEAQQAVKDAVKAEKAAKRAAIGQMFNGIITIPTRIIGAVAEVCNNHPRSTILPAIALTVAANVVDTDKINLTDSFPSMPDVSMSSSNDNNGPAIQVAALGSYSDAKRESDRLSKKHPSLEFNTSGSTVQSTSSCPELVLNGVVADQSKCNLGIALAKN